MQGTTSRVATPAWAACIFCNGSCNGSPETLIVYQPAPVRNCTSPRRALTAYVTQKCLLRNGSCTCTVSRLPTSEMEPCIAAAASSPACRCETSAHVSRTRSKGVQRHIILQILAVEENPLPESRGQGMQLSQSMLQSLHVLYLFHRYARHSFPGKHSELQHLRGMGI